MHICKICAKLSFKTRKTLQQQKVLFFNDFDGSIYFVTQEHPNYIQGTRNKKEKIKKATNKQKQNKKTTRRRKDTLKIPEHPKSETFDTERKQISHILW